MNANSTIQSLRGEIAQSLSVLKRLEDYFIVLRIRTLCGECTICFFGSYYYA